MAELADPKTPMRDLVSGKLKWDYYEGKVDGFEVFSWCPTPQPTVPPTQVHLHIPLAGGKIVFRFKGPDTLDRLIAALQDHRKDVSEAWHAAKLGRRSLGLELVPARVAKVTGKTPEKVGTL